MPFRTPSSPDEARGGRGLHSVHGRRSLDLAPWLSVGSRAEVFRVPPLGHLSFAVALAIFDGFRAGSQVCGVDLKLQCSKYMRKLLALDRRGS